MPRVPVARPRPPRRTAAQMERAATVRMTRRLLRLSMRRLQVAAMVLRPPPMQVAVVRPEMPAVVPAAAVVPVAAVAPAAAVVQGHRGVPVAPDRPRARWRPRRSLERTPRA